MATYVTTLPGSAPPLSPGHLRWELAVVLKGLSKQLPPDGSSVLPWILPEPPRALPPWASLSPAGFLRAYYAPALIRAL